MRRWWLLLCALAACTRPAPPPQLTAVAPTRGPGDRATPIVITGEGFQPKLLTDFTSPHRSVLDPSFSAHLGHDALDEVQLQPDGSLSAVVPAGLAAGTYDLSVTTPAGLVLVLPRAYRVLASGEMNELVAGFRFEALAAQRVGVPFPIKLFAVDAAGATVDRYSGTATLSDLTGTAVPVRVGPFARGLWEGLVEIRAAHGADVLSVADGAVQGVSNTFEVAPGPATRLAFSTPAHALAAGACSPAVTLTLLDDAGLPTTSAAALPLSLTPHPTLGVTLFSDAACTTALAPPSLGPGAATATLHFRATRAGPLSLKATAAGVGPASQVQQVTPAPAERLVFTSPEPTLNAGTCSMDVTVETRDVFDNPVPVAAALAVTLEPEAGSGLLAFDAGGCTTAATGLTLAPGESTGHFRLQGTTAGAWQVSASAPGLSTATLRVRVNPAGFPTQLVFVSPAQQVQVATCSGAVAIQSQDASGNAVSNPGSFAVALTAAPSSGFTFYADVGCTTPITQLTLGAGKSTELVYFRGMQTGVITLTAAASGLQSGTQTETLLPGPANRITFTSAAQTITAGTCSNALQLHLEDSLGNPAPSSGPTAVTFSGAPSTGLLFFTDVTCSTPGNVVTIGSGQTTGQLFARPATAGSLTLTASSPGLTPAQQVETVVAGPAATLAITSAAQTQPAGGCSAVVTVESQDAFGNPTPVSAQTAVALSAAPASGFAFFSDPGCATAVTGVTLAAMSGATTFFFNGTAPGPVSVTASASGLMPGTQVETITPGAAARLVFTTPARAANAGACSPLLTVEVRDGSGNATPVATATLLDLAATPSSGFAFYSDPACGSAITQAQVDASATSASFYFRGTLAQGIAVTASSGALTPAAQNQTVTPAPADRLVFRSAPLNLTAGACSPAIAIARADPFGNDSPDAAATPVALVAAPSAGFTFFSDSSCGTAASSVAIGAGSATGAYWIIATTAGVVQMTISASGLTPANQDVTVSAANAPTQLVFTTPARTVVAGDCTAVLSLETRDSFNNPRAVLSDTPVTFSAAPAAGAGFFSDSGCTTPLSGVTLTSGQSTTSFFARATAAGTGSVTASATGLNPATQALTVSAAPPDRLAFTTAAQSLAAGACSTIASLEARDPFGNPSAPSAAQAVALSSGAGITFYSDAGCASAVTSVTLGAGAGSVGVYFRGTLAGSRTLLAQVSGWSAATQPATIGAGAASQLAFTTPPRAQLAGGCSLVLGLETRDSFGNPAPVSAATAVALSANPSTGFTFYSDAGCTLALTQVTIGSGASSGAFYVRGLVVGAVVVTASAAGLTPASQTVTVSTGAAAQVAFVTPARSTVAGDCSLVLTVELRDAFGNPSPAASPTQIDLSAVPALGFTFAAVAGCGTTTTSITVATGASTASFYVRGTTSGSVVVTAASTGLTSGQQTETITPAAATLFVWGPIASPRSLAVPFGVAVTARDAFGNVATGFTGSATLTLAPAGAVGCTSSCSSSTVTDLFVAGAWSGTVTVSGAAAVGTNRTLTATQGAINGTSNPFTVSGAAARTPPSARFTTTGGDVLGTVTLDASGSSDYQTATGSLSVSWDFDSSQTGPPPWTAWSTTKTVNHTYAPGLHRVRLAVRDADGDIGTRIGFVRVFALLDAHCQVTTNADVDDGATSCAGLGGQGLDGQLSLAEAIRLANAASTTTEIDFSGPMTLSGSGGYTITHSLNLVARSGVLLVGKSLNVSGSGVTAHLYGLEMSGQAQVSTLSASSSTLFLHDVSLHDLAGFKSTGTNLTLEQVSLANCTGPCLELATTGAGTLQVRHSELRDSPGQSGILISACADASPVLDVSATTFTALGAGIRSLCGGQLTIRHNTFDALGTGISWASGAGQVVANNLFSSTGEAANCGTATFTTRTAHGLFNNTSDGCLAGDPGALLADPLYAFPASHDLRLSATSPARDSATDLGLDLTLTLPGNFIGPSPDRGGRETY